MAEKLVTEGCGRVARSASRQVCKASLDITLQHMGVLIAKLTRRMW